MGSIGIILMVIAGIVVTGIIVLALIGLSYMESPERKSQRAKDQILKEMLDQARSDEERRQIIKMASIVDKEPIDPIDEDEHGQEEENNQMWSTPLGNSVEAEAVVGLNGSPLASGIFSNVLESAVTVPEQAANGTSDSSIANDSGMNNQALDKTMELNLVFPFSRAAETVPDEQADERIIEAPESLLMPEEQRDEELRRV